MKSGNNSLDWSIVRKAQTCKVLLERLKAPTLPSHNNNTKEDKTKSTNSAYRLKVGENSHKIKHLTRPCHIVLKRCQQKCLIRPIREKSKLRCRVMLEKLRHVEIEVTTPANGFCQVHYTLEATAGSADVSEFEDYRTVKFKTITSRKSAHKSLQEREDKKLFIRLPKEASFVFNVKKIKGRLPCILSVLSGEKMSNLALDAYLALELESFKHCDCPSSSSANLQYLSILYFPLYQTDEEIIHLCRPDRKYSPKGINESTILIAPQLTCNHFYLAIYDFPSRIIHVYDSAWKFLPLNLRFLQVQTILKFLLKNNPHLNQSWKQWSVNFKEKCAQQTDEVNCGCYVIHFTRNLLNGKTTSEANLQKLGEMELVEIRRDIVRKLLPTTKLGNQILEAIS